MPGRSLAERISAVTSPYLTVPAFILMAGYAFVTDPPELLLYWGITVGFTVGLPLSYAHYLTTKGRVDSVHIYDQRSRLGPLALTAASSLAGLYLLYLIGAPDGILRLAVLLPILALVTLGATALLKISGHVSAWATGSTVVIVLHGAYALPLLLGAVPIGWSRLAMGRHRPVEVVAGLLFGIGTAALLTLLLGLW